MNGGCRDGHRRAEWIPGILIFLVDHSAGIPRGKRWCYDLGVRVPLIVRWPKGIARGIVHPGLVGWVDVAPQILA